MARRWFRLNRLASIACVIVFPVMVSAQQPSPQKIQELFSAVKSENVELTKALLIQPGATNARNQEGMTPLHCAAFRGSLPIAKVLLAAGTDANARDSIGMTPLHAAAFEGHVKVTRLLLEAHSKVGAQDIAGMTPLHYAALGGHRDETVVLLQAGADPSAKDRRGRTPLDLARGGNHADVVKEINAHQARAQTGSQPPKKAVRTYTDEDVVLLRYQGTVLSDQEGTPQSRPYNSSDDYRLRNIQQMEDEISSLVRRKRDLEASLPELQKRCEDAQEKPRDNSSPIGSYSREEEWAQNYAVQQACSRFYGAQDQIRQMDYQIDNYRKNLERMRLESPSTR